MSILLLVLGLLLFVGLVVVHEFGHFIMARRNGIAVEEFGIGFPPRAKLLTKKKGTVYTLNWLPLGGFVKLKGEHDADRSVHSFGAASLGAKLKVLLAGVSLNLVTAFGLLTLIAWVGMPQLLPDQFKVASDAHNAQPKVVVMYVEPGSPADRAGLQSSDQIAAIGLVNQSKTALTGQAHLTDITKRLAGQSVELVVRHHGKLATKLLKLRSTTDIQTAAKRGQQIGYLGVGQYNLVRSTWSAPVVAGGLIKQMTSLTFKALGGIVTGLFHGHAKEATDQVAGPVGIFVVLKEGHYFGYQFILFIIATLSLSLAIMNTLPIPAMDGGRLFTMLFFRLIRQPLTKQREELINGTGFALLMVLFVLITFVDVRRFF